MSADDKTQTSPAKKPKPGSRVPATPPPAPPVPTDPGQVTPDGHIEGHIVTEADPDPETD